MYNTCGADSLGAFQGFRLKGVFAEFGSGIQGVFWSVAEAGNNKCAGRQDGDQKTITTAKDLQ